MTADEARALTREATRKRLGTCHDQFEGGANDGPRAFPGHVTSSSTVLRSEPGAEPRDRVIWR